MGLDSRCCSEGNFSSLSVFASTPPVNKLPSSALYTKQHMPPAATVVVFCSQIYIITIKATRFCVFLQIGLLYVIFMSEIFIYLLNKLNTCTCVLYFSLPNSLFRTRMSQCIQLTHYLTTLGTPLIYIQSEQYSAAVSTLLGRSYCLQLY